MLTKTQRTEQIDLLETRLKDARGIYLTEVDRITVEKISKLRTGFRKGGVQYFVVKNSLAKKALQRLGVEQLIPFLKGEVGIAVSKTDATVPAKIIKEFQKTNENLLKVKAAFVEGSLFSDADVTKLALLPSKEVLLSQLLSCLQAPMTNLACTLQSIIAKCPATLEAVRVSKENAQ